jgi:hypothetical protein
MDFAVNYLAVIVAAIAGAVINALWYSVVFKAPVSAVRKADANIGGRDPAPPFYGVALASQLVMAFVLSVIIHTAGQMGLGGGVLTAFFTWLGFSATVLSVTNVFGYRQPAFIVIDGGNWLVTQLVMGAIIGSWA